jgi:murein L,D-transpeptidase YafK
MHGRVGFGASIVGDCSSRGTFALTGKQLGKFLDLIGPDLKTNGVPVHIFPFRMEEYEFKQSQLANEPFSKVDFSTHTSITEFWRMLQGGYQFDNTRHEIPSVYILGGNYIFRDPGSPPPVGALDLYN